MYSIFYIYIKYVVTLNGNIEYKECVLAFDPLFLRSSSYRYIRRHCTSHPWLTPRCLQVREQAEGFLKSIVAEGKKAGTWTILTPLFYPSSRNYQSCERHNTYIYIYIYNIYIYIHGRGIFSPSQVWRPSSPILPATPGASHARVGSCPLGTRRLDIVSVRLCLCCSLCFQSSPAWSTSECLPGREKPVATRRRRVCNGGPLRCSPHPARGHRPPIRGVLEWGAVNVVKYSLYLYNSHLFQQESMWLLYLCLFCHAQPKKSRPRPRPGLFFREEPHKKNMPQAEDLDWGLSKEVGGARECWKVGAAAMVECNWQPDALHGRAFNFFVLDAHCEHDPQDGFISISLQELYQLLGDCFRTVEPSKKKEQV